MKSRKRPIRTKAKRSPRKGAQARPVPVHPTWTTDDFEIRHLQFDKQNPRLPENLKNQGQDDLLRFIAQNYEPIEIARSIAKHGFFLSEPIIVVKEAGLNVVVEGNRRLAALKLLSDKKLATQLELSDEEEWVDLASKTSVPTTVPGVLAATRHEVAPILGFRHISGIEPWDPWAQARFLAGFVDNENLSFAEAAELVGEPERGVRETYRNYRIVRQIEGYGTPIERVRNRFGVFTRAMQESNIRDFLGAPPATEIVPKANPLSGSKGTKQKAAELVEWVFGSQAAEPIFSDSRKISDLGVVLASRDGLKELRATRDLEQAFLLAGGVKGRLLTRLGRAASSLSAARQDYALYKDEPDVQDSVAACKKALEDLIEADAEE
jgi:hypothetical protein